MDTKSLGVSTLDSRDMLILQLTARHRLITNDVVRRLYCPAGQPNAAVKITARLARAGLLHKFPLIHPQVYFTLTEKACQHLGGGPYRSQPLGPQALPSEFAALLYCTCGPRYHERLSNGEVRASFPWFPDPSRHEIYCLDQPPSSQPILEWVRTDLGGPGHHVIRKSRRKLDRRLESHSFAGALDEGTFRIVFLTTTPEKAKALQDALAPDPWPAGALIHIAVIPQLFRLTVRYRNGS